MAGFQVAAEVFFRGGLRSSIRRRPVMLRAAMLPFVTAAVLSIVSSTWTPGPGRELSEREKWLTFGGINDQKCVFKLDCLIDPDDQCDSEYAKSGQAPCVTSEHDVVGSSDGEHCQSWYPGWLCSHASDTVCRTTLHCRWVPMNNPPCEQIPIHEDGLKSEASAPDTCTSGYVGG
jgi:hypothetical protein